MVVRRRREVMQEVYLGVVRSLGCGVAGLRGLAVVPGGDVNVECSMFNVQCGVFWFASSFNIQHSTLNIEHSTFPTPRNPETAQPCDPNTKSPRNPSRPANIDMPVKPWQFDGVVRLTRIGTSFV